MPEFFYDDEMARVMFRCPHQDDFGTLPSVIWKVVKIEPLTVTPSVWNTGCGCHGFIRNGEWVPA